MITIMDFTSAVNPIINGAESDTLASEGFNLVQPFYVIRTNISASINDISVDINDLCGVDYDRFEIFVPSLSNIFARFRLENPNVTDPLMLYGFSGEIIVKCAYVNPSGETVPKMTSLAVPAW